jgi:hypothetical protein
VGAQVNSVSAGLDSKAIILTVDGQPIDANHSIDDLVRKRSREKAFLLCGISPLNTPSRAVREFTILANIIGFDDATPSQVTVDCKGVRKMIIGRLKKPYKPDKVKQARALFAQLTKCSPEQGILPNDLANIRIKLENASR